MIDGRTEDNNTKLRQRKSEHNICHDIPGNVAPDTKVPDGQPDDGQRQNNIPPPLAREYIHTKFQRNPPKRFQDMAPDTKMPINPPKNFQDMAPDTKVPDGQTDSRTDGRTTPKQYPSASGGG
ncbi:hypothetical protein DPMN_025949 [Dreissena polymorpha]|uniref:Uncharacterized protein n=1 Tax=Dreissena polymorpha TaxID=45954 RepID=A0A9D4LQP7_DREPO|nr:hypothetical protein DPMN_025949 [Dreissena polymorpha]